jgi:hypothetical protein
MNILVRFSYISWPPFKFYLLIFTYLIYGCCICIDYFLNVHDGFVINYVIGMYDGSILDYLLSMDGVFVVYLFVEHDFSKLDKSKKYA